MAVKLNHTLVDSRDRDASALFLSEMLGIDPPLVLGPFALVFLGITGIGHARPNAATG